MYILESHDGIVVVTVVVWNRSELLQECTVVHVNETLRNEEQQIIFCHQLLVSRFTDSLCEVNCVVVIEDLTATQDV